MTNLLQVHDLYKIHAGSGEDQPVLRGVTFDVAEGDFVCIMGPSGSGKTTLLHLLSGLDEPSAGSVILAGKDLAKAKEEERTRQRRDQVGYVFQFFHLMPNLSVMENIGLPLAIAGQNPDRDAARIRELGKKLGIEDRLGAFPHELSGGEMQRASIARALIGGQPLLLCDEPTGNLAQAAGREVMEELQRANREEGRTVVLVTHNPRDAAFAHRVLFLVDGELSGDTLEGDAVSETAVVAALQRLSI
ncbi:ABC transporter ATP-binding protein YxdL [Planctomycetes bacterium Poly30]|uniref:ABC transporter ATP-binding protein YxdL n=1 Tax=Saltatorellus ferox TaxID=2528018 RepID=A0A518EQ34_9BACT|nr:ABC transporter ATP-binding protein YxdL [Planctomycetes bacterium Poly30]